LSRVKYALNDRTELKPTLCPCSEATVRQPAADFCSRKPVKGCAAAVNSEVKVSSLSEEGKGLTNMELVVCREIPNIRIIVAQIKKVSIIKTNPDMLPCCVHPSRREPAKVDNREVAK
jgi:hypothetical protein